MRLPLLLALAFAAPPATATSTARVTVRSGVSYGTGPTARGPAPLLLDVYEPAGPATGARPAVVLVHGGGFVAQSRTDEGIVRIARGLAAEGIVTLSIDYRLAGQAPIPSARVQPLVDALPDIPVRPAIAAAADDTLTAVAWLRAHAAQLHVDPRRLGLVGSSAGAITVDQIAYAFDDLGIAAPRPRFVASLWGGIIVPPGAQQLGRGEPALFAVHGDADGRVPVGLDDALVARARAHGVHADYYRIPGAVHGYDGSRFFGYDTGDGLTPYDRLLTFAERRLR